MSNSIPEEYWSFNGTSLHKYCWAIKTFGGSRYALPPIRGENILYPYRPGRAFASKMADSRVITLAMWVAGVDDNTDNPHATDQLVQFNDNLNALRKLFWTPYSEGILTRRWKLNTVSPEIIVAEARAQIAGTMDPSMTGRTRADFAVDLLLADPFFYGDEITVNIPMDVDVNVFNPGDVEVAYQNFDMVFNGELVSPLLINHSIDPEVSMTLNTLVPPETTVDVDVSQYLAYRSFDGSNVSAAISHTGAKQWMYLQPGDNILHLHGEGTGAVTLTFRPPYL